MPKEEERDRLLGKLLERTETKKQFWFGSLQILTKLEVKRDREKDSTGLK